MISERNPTRRSLLLAASAAGIVSGFEAKGSLFLRQLITDPGFRGRLKASDVALLTKQESLTREHLMLKLLPFASAFSHAPLSNYHVGAVMSGVSGALYLGANIEIPANILGLAVHAEQAAVANAYMAEETGLDALAVTAAPCGHCRQFLSELSLDKPLPVLINAAPAILLSQLLPMPFGPRDLGFSKGALPVLHQGLSLTSQSSNPLAIEALKAANASYSPYTKSPSGIAFATSNNRVFTGSYIENAAFNPSLPPLQAALAGYFTAGSGAGDIREVILVEGVQNRISQQSACISTLDALAPSAKVQRLAAGSLQE